MDAATLQSKTEPYTSPPIRILVVAYDERSRGLLAEAVLKLGAEVISCASFVEAETAALTRLCSGILVDLVAMVKSPPTEKPIAHTLTNIYPTLRAKIMGPMLVPMAMAGDKSQDKSLAAFVNNTCSNFHARTLRHHRRKPVCRPAMMDDLCGFTTDVSWGGAFIVVMEPQLRFQVGDQVDVVFPDLGVEIPVRVARVSSWGGRRPPGIGVVFLELTNALEAALLGLLGTDKHTDRDRLA